MNIILIAILAVNFATLAIIGLAFIKIRRKYDDFIDLFNAFMRPAEEGKESEFARLISVIADSIARSIVALAKTTFMGKASGDARLGKSIDADIAEGMLAQTNPMLSGVLQMFPGLRKTLRRNPGALDMIASKLMSRAAPDQTQPSGNGHKQESLFKI